MEKCLFACDYVDLKNKEYERKHTKLRHLGDVDGKYRYRSRSCTPTLVGSLVNLELPETRAINNSTARNIIANQTKQIQGTYEKTNRVATIDAWSYPPKFEDRRVEELPRRPHTSTGVHGRDSQDRVPHQMLRPFSTGSPGRRVAVHPHAPPQLQSYMVAKLKRRHSGSNNSGRNIALKTVTTALLEQWEEEDKEEKQSPRRVQSQNAKRFDSFAGQWLSFAGGTEQEDHGGVLDAFTGEAADEYYNVESRIGANIATQLNKGNKIRVGKNGVLQSNSLKVNKWKNEVSQHSIASESSCSTYDSWGNVRKPPAAAMVPLSWDDQLDRPDVKIIEPTEKQPAKPKPDLSERHRVVFEKLVKEDNLPRHKVKLESGYKIQQRTKNKRNIDGTESLNNRITMITVDEVKEDRDSMCSEEYEELLQRSLQTSDTVTQIESEPVIEPGVIDNAQDSREQFNLSPPAPSLANESQDTFAEDDLPPSPRTSFHLNKISMSSDEIIRPVSRQVSSAASTTRQSSGKIQSTPRQLARAVPSAPIMSARTTRSNTTSVRSASPKRAQSSPPRRNRKYQFDDPPTPRNIHSPRPNLAKPGQLARSGVASINASSQDGGEQEYIKISQQLLPPSGNRRSYSAASRSDVSRISSGTELDTVMDANRNDSISINSMDVNKGDNDILHHHDDDHRHCTCSPEAKRVLSAALSHMSNASDPNAVISIPTAINTEVDVQSNAGSSAGSFYSEKSDLLNELESPSASGRETPTDFDKQEPDITSNEQSTETNNVDPTEAQNVEIPGSSSNQDIYINQTDGLAFNQNDLEQMNKDIEQMDVPKSRSNSAASKKKRSVKFADEQESLSVPYCTPSSTPREQTSDIEDG